jgi:hypothetical protein
MPASIEFGCFRITPHRREPQRFSSRGYQFAGEIRMIAAMPHTWAVATSVVPVSELIGRDFEFEEIVGLIAAHRLMVPTVMAKHTTGLSEIVRHDHRAKARKVEGGARQRRPYVDVEDPGSADRARREGGRAAVDRGARLLGLHGYGPGTLRLGDRQDQYKEET